MGISEGDRQRCIDALEAQLLMDPAPDVKMIIIDGVNHSTRSLLDEVRNRTPLGDEIVESHTEIIESAIKESDDL